MTGAFFLLVEIPVGGCKRTAPDTVAAPTTPSAGLIFPETLYVADASVNAFIRRVMDICASGDYETFCTLWTHSDNVKPMDRREFERGWKAVREIRVLALRTFRNEAEGPLHYFLEAETDFDDSVSQPSRKVELVIVKEDGQWRLRPAPHELRDRLDAAAQGEPREPS